MGGKSVTDLGSSVFDGSWKRLAAAKADASRQRPRQQRGITGILVTLQKDLYITIRELIAYEDVSPMV